MRKMSYWICFAVVAVHSCLQFVSAAFSLAGKHFYWQIPIGSLDPFGLLHFIPWPLSVLPSILLSYGMLFLVIRRMWLLSKGMTAVPSTFKGVPQTMAYLGAGSVVLGVLVLILSMLVKAGSGVPAGLMLIPASICVPWVVFLTEGKEVLPYLSAKMRRLRTQSK